MSIPVPLHGFGSGSAVLNFKVAAYGNKDALLADKPAANTLGVITDAKISSWIMAPTTPADMGEGMLWIRTASESPASFNALKKNSLQINPVAAKQMVSGALVEKTAYLYTAAGWVQIGYPTVYLYRNGDRNFEITGDFHKDSPTGDLVPDGTAEDGTKYLDFYNHGTLYKTIPHYTGKLIDVTPFKYLTQVGLHSRPEDPGDTIKLVDESGNSVAEVSAIASGDMQTLTLDISNITGSYYIMFDNFNNGYDNWDMYELYLSPE